MHNTKKINSNNGSWKIFGETAVSLHLCGSARGDTWFRLTAARSRACRSNGSHPAGFCRSESTHGGPHGQSSQPSTHPHRFRTVDPWSREGTGSVRPCRCLQEEENNEITSEEKGTKPRKGRSWVLPPFRHSAVQPGVAKQRLPSVSTWPRGHSHRKPRSVLTHPCEQLWRPVAHSSMSISQASPRQVEGHLHLPWEREEAVASFSF